MDIKPYVLCWQLYDYGDNTLVFSAEGEHLAVVSLDSVCNNGFQWWRKYSNAHNQTPPAA